MRIIGLLRAMPIYRYSALADNGLPVKGEHVAATESDLARTLAARGLLLQGVRSQGASWLSRSGRVDSTTLLLFNHELTALLRAGLALPEALRLTAQRPHNTRMGKILQRVLEDVQRGVDLSAACRSHPEMFDNVYIAALTIAERTGGMAEALTRLQLYLRQRAELRKKLTQAMIYPLFLLGTLILVLLALLIFVLPRFAEMYSDLDAALPVPTQALLTLTAAWPVYLSIFIVMGMLGWVTWRMVNASTSARLAADRFWNKLPLIGFTLRSVAITRTAHTLTTLLAGGTPLVEALYVAEQAAGAGWTAQRLHETARRVSGGESLASAFQQVDLMPDIAIKMIEVGETTGELAAMLHEVAQFYEERLSTLLSRVMSLLEPAMMLLIGLLVGSVIIVMYLPIFSIAEVVQ